MTKEAQRIAIAEACGWTGIEDRSEALMMAPGFSVWGYPPVNPLVGHKEQVPRFVDDLNAMHEAFLTLDDCQQNNFFSYLVEVGFHNSFVSRDKVLDALKATAAQWAEAFLRTKGLWVGRT